MQTARLSADLALAKSITGNPILFAAALEGVVLAGMEESGEIRLALPGERVPGLADVGHEVHKFPTLAIRVDV